MNARHDVRGALGIYDDVLDGLADLDDIGSGPVQPPQPGGAVGGDGREGLVDLVGDRCGEFSEHRDARGMRELSLNLLKLLLSANTL